MLKKVMFMTLCLIMFASSAYSSVGVRNTGTRLGAAADINFGSDLTATKSGSVVTVNLSDAVDTDGDITFRSNVIAIGRIAASSSLDSSSNGIGVGNVPYVYIRKIVSGTEALTIPDGTTGQILVLIFVQDAPGSGSTWTLTPTTSQVFDTILMTAVADQVTLLYIDDSIGWIVLVEEGTVTVTYNLDGN